MGVVAQPSIACSLARVPTRHDGRYATSCRRRCFRLEGLDLQQDATAIRRSYRRKDGLGLGRSYREETAVASLCPQDMRVRLIWPGPGRWESSAVSLRSRHPSCLGSHRLAAATTSLLVVDKTSTIGSATPVASSVAKRTSQR